MNIDEMKNGTTIVKKWMQIFLQLVNIGQGYVILRSEIVNSILEMTWN